MCQIKSINKISPEKPPDSLFSPQIIWSIVGQLIPQMVFITIMYFMMIREPWYIEPDTGSEVIYNVHCTAVMFWFCNFQYLTPGFLFSFGRDFHKPFYKCFWVMFICILILIANVFVLFQDFDPISDFFEFPNGDYSSFSSSASMPLENPPPIPYDFRWKILGMSVLNFVVCLAIEEFVIRVLPGLVKRYKDRYGDNEVFTPKIRSEFERLCHRNTVGTNSSNDNNKTTLTLSAGGPSSSSSSSTGAPSMLNIAVNSPEAIGTEIKSTSVSPHPDGGDTEPLIPHGKKSSRKKAKMDQMLARYEKSIRKSRGKSPGLPEDDDIDIYEGDDYYGASGFSPVPSGNQVTMPSSPSSILTIGGSSSSSHANSNVKNKKNKGKAKNKNRSVAASGIVTTSSMPSVPGATIAGNSSGNTSKNSKKKYGKKKGSSHHHYDDDNDDDGGEVGDDDGDICVQISDDDDDSGDL